MNYWFMQQHGWTWKQYVQLKKSDTTDHILYDYIYMKCPERANLEKQKAHSSCLGLEVDMELIVNGHEGYYWGGKNVLKLIYVDECTIQ